MLKKFSKVDNPLTIIAIFAGITEVVTSVALPFLQQETQQIFVWFLILFPFALIGAFFLTLNFNTKVLYAPADYRDEKHFLEALRLSKDTIQLSVTSAEDAPPSIEKLERSAATESGMSPFEGITKSELDTVNKALEVFGGKAKRLFESELITSYSFGVHGEGLFLVNALLRDVTGSEVESRIIRARTKSGGKVELSIVGKGASSSHPEQFGDMLYKSLEGTIRHRKEQEQAKRRPNKAAGSDG